MIAKHPGIIVTLTDNDGNAFIMIGRCCQAPRGSSISEDKIAAFTVEAMAGDYAHMLQTAMQRFDRR